MGLKQAISKKRIEAALFAAMFCLLLLLKPSFIKCPEGLPYVTSAVTGEPQAEISFHAGYVLFFKGLYGLFDCAIEVYGFHDVIRGFNILFSCICVVLAYHAAKDLFEDKYVGVSSALIFGLYSGYIRYSTSVFPDIASTALMLLSVILFHKAHKMMSMNMLVYSGVFLGLALLFHINVVILLTAYAAYVFAEDGRFGLEEYTTVLILALFLGFIATSYYFVEDESFRQKLAERIKLPKMREPAIASIIRWDHTLFAIGSAFLINERRYRIASSLIMMCLPAAFLCWTNMWTMECFTSSMFGCAAISGYALVQIGRSRFFRLGGFTVTQSTALLLIAYIVLSLPETLESASIRDETSKRCREYGLKMMGYPEGTTYLIGSKAEILNDYFVPLSGSERNVIGAGVEWAPGEIEASIRRELARGKVVLVDFGSYEGRQLKTIEDLRYRFDFREIEDNISKINLR